MVIEFFHNLIDQGSDDLLLKLNEKAIEGGIKEKYPPLSLDTVAACERWLGFRLPTLLKRVYTEVANGGVGPGEALIGLADGKRSAFNERYALDLIGICDVFYNYAYGWDEQDDYGALLWQWPTGLLPVSDWGDFDLTVLDCKSGRAPMLQVNYRQSINYKKAFKQKTAGVFKFPGVSLATWLASSIDGREGDHFPLKSEAQQLRDSIGWKTPPAGEFLGPPPADTHVAQFKVGKIHKP